MMTPAERRRLVEIAIRVRRHTTHRDIIDLCDYVINVPPNPTPLEQVAEVAERAEPKRRPGRPPAGERAQTTTERSRAYRDRKKEAMSHG